MIPYASARSYCGKNLRNFQKPIDFASNEADFAKTSVKLWRELGGTASKKRNFNEKKGEQFFPNSAIFICNK